MFATLPVLLGGAVVSSIASPALTSFIVFGAAPFVGTDGLLFRGDKPLHMLILFTLLPGMLAEFIAARATVTHEGKLLQTGELCCLSIETTNDGIGMVDGGQGTSFVNRQMAEMRGLGRTKSKHIRWLTSCFSERRPRNLQVSSGPTILGKFGDAASARMRAWNFGPARLLAHCSREAEN